MLCCGWTRPWSGPTCQYQTANVLCVLGKSLQCRRLKLRYEIVTNIWSWMKKSNRLVRYLGSLALCISYPAWFRVTNRNVNITLGQFAQLGYNLVRCALNLPHNTIDLNLFGLGLRFVTLEVVHIMIHRFWGGPYRRPQVHSAVFFIWLDCVWQGSSALPLLVILQPAQIHMMTAIVAMSSLVIHIDVRVCRSSE